MLIKVFWRDFVDGIIDTAENVASSKQNTYQI